MAEIRSRNGWYDSALVELFEKIIATQAREDVRFIKVRELAPNMILDQDVRTASGILLIAKGQEVTPSMHQRLENFARIGEGIQEPIKVLIQVGGHAK